MTDADDTILDGAPSGETPSVVDPICSCVSSRHGHLIQQYDPDCPIEEHRRIAERGSGETPSVEAPRTQPPEDARLVAIQQQIVNGFGLSCSEAQYLWDYYAGRVPPTGEALEALERLEHEAYTLDACADEDAEWMDGEVEEVLRGAANRIRESVALVRGALSGLPQEPTT